MRMRVWVHAQLLRGQHIVRSCLPLPTAKSYPVQGETREVELETAPFGLRSPAS